MRTSVSAVEPSWKLSFKGEVGEVRGVYEMRRLEKWKWVEVGQIGGHERSIFSISWRKAQSGNEENGEGRGWLASVSGDGRINVWSIRVSYFS